MTLAAPPAAGGAMDANGVYIPLSTDQIVALDRQTGTIRWMREIETAWPPVSDGTNVFVVASDELHALDAATGATRWRVPILRPAMAPPMFAAGMVIMLMEPDDVLAFRPSDGATMWRTSVGGTAGAFSARATATAVYLSAPRSRVIALGIADGRKLWERALPGDLSQPTAARDRVFIGSTDNFFYALAADDGKLAWKWRSGGDVIGAAATDEAAYFVSLDNVLRAVNRGNGNQRWRKSTPTRPVLPPRVVGGEVLLVGLMPTLSTFDGRTGAPVNTYNAPGEVEGEPLVDTTLRPFSVAAVIITRDGRVVGLRPQSINYREADPVALPALPGKTLPREQLPR
jgi:outer membrane protein assembly factor BamB